MRVAIFTDTYPPYVNGVSTSCFNLANALKARGDEVLVVAPNPKAQGAKLEQVGDVLYIPGMTLRGYYGFRITNMFASEPVKIIKKFNPEVIHVQTDLLSLSWLEDTLKSTTSQLFIHIILLMKTIHIMWSVALWTVLRSVF